MERVDYTSNLSLCKRSAQTGGQSTGLSGIPSQKEATCMRKLYAVSLLLIAVTLGNLACKSNSAAALSKEDKYKIYFASTMTNDKEFQKEVIKKLGVGHGDSTIPDHEFFVAFIDWMERGESDKLRDEVGSPEKARAYVNKQLPN
jgi:hypothetical protein